jgi:hypothetical protein
MSDDLAVTRLGEPTTFIFDRWQPGRAMNSIAHEASHVLGWTDNNNDPWRWGDMCGPR